MKRVISMLISISMVLAMLPTFVLADNESLTTYNSNANFSTTAGNGTWDNGVWRAEYYDSSTQTYSTVSSVYNSGYAADTWTWNQPQIKGDTLMGQNVNPPTQHPVRTFIAPRAGTVKIAAASITQGTWSNITYNIKHNDTQKWTYTTNQANTINQPEQSFEVKKGDLIRFEVILDVATTYGHTQTWTNEITYTEPEPEATPKPTLNPEKATFNSSTDTETIEDSEDGTWGCGVWRAEMLQEDTYTVMKEKSNAAAVEACKNGFTTQDTYDYPIVLGTILTDQRTDTTPIKYPSRVFVAPKTGVIKIDSATITRTYDKSYIYRIKHNDTEIWTVTAQWNEHEISQPEKKIYVNQGDLVRFEVLRQEDGWHSAGHTWTNVISYVEPDKEITPEISIDYENEKLVGFEKDGSYEINNKAVTLDDNNLSVVDYFGKNISIVKKGNGTTTTDSDVQSLQVPSRPQAPGTQDIVVTQPSVIGGKGTITGVTSAMEYKLSTDENWSQVTDNIISELETGEYNIRIKATESSFKSDIFSVEINEFTPDKENTPNIRIDYKKEKLCDFEIEGSYKIDSADVTIENGELSVGNYIGKTISIIKAGNGTTTTDSDAQILEIPNRISAPEVVAVDEVTTNGNDGKITGVNTKMEYKLSTENAWSAVEGEEITNLAPAVYNVRFKATDNAFASAVSAVTVNAHGLKEPIVTVPTIKDVTYKDDMKLSDVSLSDIQIPSGDTQGDFSWKTADIPLKAGDNQKFTVIFTPTNKNDYKSKEVEVTVNVKSATITGITVTGFEGEFDDKEHSVTVTGTRDGDVITYKVDDGSFDEKVPEFKDVCDHTVTVKVTRANYSDFSESVKIKINEKVVPTPTPTPTLDPNKNTFNSNENFSTSTENGEWDFGVWRAEMLQDNTYTLMKYINDGGYTASDKDLYNYPILYGDKFIDERTNSIPIAYPSRVFVAPKDGLIDIESATISRTQYQQYKYRIKHNDKEIWTVTAEYNALDIAQPETMLSVKKGDLIRFEVLRQEDGWYSGGHTWTNVISYIDDTQEKTPEITIDYANEQLTGFKADGIYEINKNSVTPENGKLNVSDYIGQTLSIVKKSKNDFIEDSKAQTLKVPQRPSEPQGVTAVDEENLNGNDGKLIGVDGTMEYKLSTSDTWTIVTGTEVTNLAPAVYDVRIKATSTAFASKKKSFTINSKGAIEPTITITSVGDVTYVDDMKLSNVSLLDIQIPDGDTPGTFDWIEPNTHISAGDNQKFSARFTPTDTSAYKTKVIDLSVNIKPATITGITVTGFEGEKDGNQHSVTVAGTREGDKLTYKIDDGEFTEKVPSYKRVCDHTVTVKVSRENYVDFTATVKLKVTEVVLPNQYVSSEKFSTSTADAKWDNGIWEAKCYVASWYVFSDLTNITDGKYNLSWLYDGFARVDGTTIETDKTNVNYTTRAFVPSRAGIIEIAETTVENTGDSAVKVRITRTGKEGNSTLWEEVEIPAGGTVTQPKISEQQVAVGDFIYFQVASVTDGTRSSVNWVNTVNIQDLPPEPTPTPEPPLEAGTYRSSHNFSNESGNGQWADGVWKAEIYNSTSKKYTDAKQPFDDAYAENDMDEDQPLVFGDRFKVTSSKSVDKHPVRTFVVQNDGKIRILKTEITHNTWEKVQYVIKLNDEVIWSKIWDDSSEKLVQPEKRIDVKKGDVVRFIAILKESTNYGLEQYWTNTIIEWDGAEPTPTPIPPNPMFTETKYQASDSFNLDENGDDVWKWKSYKVSEKKYEDLTTTMDSNLMMGEWNEELGDFEDGPAWIAGSDWRWAAIGKTTMRVSVDPGDPTTEETEGDFKVHRDYPVREFTAPKNGKINIQAAGGNIIQRTGTGGASIRIMCERADGSGTEKVFPTDGDWRAITGKYDFTPIEFEINSGDKLFFECSFIWRDGGYSPWNVYLKWDPIVEYHTITPKLVSATPIDKSENVALNAEHILTYNAELENISKNKINIYEIDVDGNKVNSEAICSAFEVKDKDIKFAFDGLKPYTKYAVQIDGVCYKGLDAENEKSETVTFTTGSAVNVGQSSFKDGKVSVEINNSYKEKATASLIVAVCKGTESSYVIENVYYITRKDIGANDTIETEVVLPDGNDYFIKSIVMENMQKARAYAPATVIKGGN